MAPVRQASLPGQCLRRKSVTQGESSRVGRVSKHSIRQRRLDLSGYCRGRSLLPWWLLFVDLPGRVPDVEGSATSLQQPSRVPDDWPSLSQPSLSPRLRVPPPPALQQPLQAQLVRPQAARPERGTASS